MNLMKRVRVKYDFKYRGQIRIPKKGDRMSLFHAAYLDKMNTFSKFTAKVN